MKKRVQKFCFRGLIFGGFGPLVYALVMLILQLSGMDVMADGVMIFKAVISTYLMAFVISGASIIWEEERLGLPVCILIHGLLVYFSYLITYLTNGWIKTDWKALGVFSSVFVIGYLLIWLMIYLIEKNKVKKFNYKLRKSND